MFVNSYISLTRIPSVLLNKREPILEDVRLSRLAWDSSPDLLESLFWNPVAHSSLSRTSSSGTPHDIALRSDWRSTIVSSGHHEILSGGRATDILRLARNLSPGSNESWMGCSFVHRCEPNFSNEESLN